MSGATHRGWMVADGGAGPAIRPQVSPGSIGRKHCRGAVGRDGRDRAAHRAGILASQSGGNSYG